MPKLESKRKIEPSKELMKTLDVIANNKSPPIISKSPPVFRLFECVVHLEIALAELKKVGIFLGEDKEIQISNHRIAVEATDSVYKSLLREWGAMPK